MILEVNSAEASGTGASVSGINWDDSGTPQALTRTGRAIDTAGLGWAEKWYVLSPSPGTKTIKVTYSGAVAATTGSASYAGVDQTTPYNAASPQTLNGTTATATLNVTSGITELVTDCAMDNETNSDTLAPGTYQTTIHNITVGFNVAGGSSDKSGAALVAMSWSGFTGSTPWAMIAASLRSPKPPGGGRLPIQCLDD